MARAHLDPAIVGLLAKKLGKKAHTIESAISKLGMTYANVTPNGRAQLYAIMHGKTVWQKLSDEDRKSIPVVETQKETVIIKKTSSKKHGEKIEILVSYNTTDTFRKGHIDEINRAWTFKCYTSVMILLRKVVENLLIDILRKKYPGTANRLLYFDVDKHRFHDFSVILKTFRAKAIDFGPEKKLVEKIAVRADELKDRANDTAHYWHSLVLRPKEIKDIDPQNILDLIAQLETRI